MSVFHGDHLHELRTFAVPVVQDVLPLDTVRGGNVFADNAKQFRFAFGAGQHAFKVDRFHIAAQVEVARFVVDVGKATRHTSSEVHAHAAEHHYATTGHVFATVVTHTFADQEHTRVADTEAFKKARAKYIG